MRTNNPVFSRPNAFAPGQQSQDGFRADYTWSPQRGGQLPGQGGYPPMAADRSVSLQGRMSIEDVITKTAVLLLALVGAGGFTWFLMPRNLLLPVAAVGSLVAFFTVMVVSARRNVPVARVIAYAVVEGVVIGGWSRLLEALYPGIVMQAVLGTIVAAAMVLAAYRFLGARVRGRLAQIVTLSIMGYAVMALISFVLYFANVNIGWSTMGPGAGPLAWLSAGVGVVLATASLLMDFDSIEQGVRMGAPEQESWRGAFGLIVTLIWLYTLLLRILSFFRSE